MARRLKLGGFEKVVTAKLEIIDKSRSAFSGGGNNNKSDCSLRPNHAALWFRSQGSKTETETKGETNYNWFGNDKDNNL